MRRDQQEPLDYATPAPEETGDARRTATGALGAVVVVLATPFLVGGIRSLLEAFRGWNRFIRSDHAYAGMIGLAIGVFGVLVGARWLWHAFRSEGGR